MVNEGARSDKSARKEFGLTQQEIVAAIRAGKLQFRESNMHGNPWFRLLRHEVEAMVSEQSGPDHLRKKKLQKELTDINQETRKMKTRLTALDRRGPIAARWKSRLRKMVREKRTRKEDCKSSGSNLRSLRA